MRTTVRIVVLATLMAASAAVSATLGASVAHAQTPMEFWHDEWARGQGAPVRQGTYPGRQDGWFGGGTYGYADPADEGMPRRGPMPQVHVSNPSFYDYRPDTLTTVSLGSICNPDAAVHPDANTDVAGEPATPSPSPPFAQGCAANASQTLRALPQVAQALAAWYGAHPQFVWSDGRSISAKAIAAMAVLNASDEVALDPADYAVSRPDLDGLDDSAAQAALARFDIALSAKTLTYALDATRGRIDPDRLSGYHDLPRKTVDLLAAMETLAQQDDAAQWLLARNPDNDRFRALVAELTRLKAAAPQRQITLDDSLRIAPGETNPRLADVLAAIGQASPDLKRTYVDAFASAQGAYRGQAVALVKAFQRAKGLSPDGVIGRNTVRALQTRDNRSGRIAKIEMALERLRWLPRSFGDRYVFLNEAAFEVSYFDGGNKPLTMRAVVGRPDAQTYFFVDRVRDVQYNPYWNVPRSIVINEMLPRLYRDGSYLDARGYEVLNQRGRQIASNSVNWAAFAKNTTGVEVRQPPGPDNALGLLKIEFPNKHAIYMHDTPEKSFFKRDMRALSHGCVRLQHPKEMAAALLGKSVGYVEKQIARGENASERVNADIPVYLAYFTAWPDQTGAVHYYDDVYDRDAHLKTAIEKTEAARKAG